MLREWWNWFLTQWLLPKPVAAEFGDPGLAPIDKALLGTQARRVLADPVLALAFDRVERRTIETWRISDPSDIKAREAAYSMVWAVRKVKDQLQEFCANAKMLEAEAKRKEVMERREAMLREARL